MPYFDLWKTMMVCCLSGAVHCQNAFWDMQHVRSQRKALSSLQNISVQILFSKLLSSSFEFANSYLVKDGKHRAIGFA